MVIVTSWMKIRQMPLVGGTIGGVLHMLEQAPLDTTKVAQQMRTISFGW